MSARLAPNAWHLARTISAPGSVALVSKLFDVEGWVCVVTGGGTGLGLTTAVALAQNGATVYIVGRREEVLLEAVDTFQPREGSGLAVPCDLASKEGILDLVAFVGAREKLVNLLLNNHGFATPRMGFASTDGTAEAMRSRVFDMDSMEHWGLGYTTNVASFYFTAFGFLPLLVAAKSNSGHPQPGSIINVGSTAGLHKTSPSGGFSYAVSKGAIRKLSTLLASTFAIQGLGVRVNVLVPG